METTVSPKPGDLYLRHSTTSVAKKNCIQVLDLNKIKEQKVLSLNFLYSTIVLFEYLGKCVFFNGQNCNDLCSPLKVKLSKELCFKLQTCQRIPVPYICNICSSCVRIQV